MSEIRESSLRRGADAAATYDALLRNGEKKLDEVAMADAVLRAASGELDDEVGRSVAMARTAIGMAIAEAATAEADAALALGRAATADVVAVADDREVANVQATRALDTAASVGDYGAAAILAARRATDENTQEYQDRAREARVRAARAEVEIALVLDEIYGIGGKP